MDLFTDFEVSFVLLKRLQKLYRKYILIANIILFHMCLWVIQKCWMTVMTKGYIVVEAQMTVDLGITMIYHIPVNPNHIYVALINVVREYVHLMLLVHIEEFNMITSTVRSFVL